MAYVQFRQPGGVSRQYQGSIPTITFKRNGKGLFLSSGLIDQYSIQNHSGYLVEVDEILKLIKLTSLHIITEKFDIKDVIYTAKAGGQTKLGNPRQIIRASELLHKLNIRPNKPVVVSPLITNRGYTIVFSYEEAYDD